VSLFREVVFRALGRRVLQFKRMEGLLGGSRDLPWFHAGFGYGLRRDDRQLVLRALAVHQHVAILPSGQDRVLAASWRRLGELDRGDRASRKVL